MTWAPLSAAQRIPSATPVVVPQPSALSTFTGIKRAPKARPAVPRPLWVDWAMVPATWVPWPWSSLACLLLWTKLRPSTQRVLPKSVAFLNFSKVSQAMPVSITATVTPRPMDSSQAVSAPTRDRCHCRSNIGSSGTNSAATRACGSTCSIRVSPRSLDSTVATAPGMRTIWMRVEASRNDGRKVTPRGVSNERMVDGSMSS